MSVLQDLQTRCTQLDRLLLQKEGQQQVFEQTRSALQQAIQETQVRAELLEKVVAVVQKLTEISRKETLDKVANIVTMALQEVKGSHLSFRINYRTRRGQAIADFVVYNSKLKSEMGIFESCGGTLVDIIEFALKVSLLLKWHPKLGKVLVLDEQFKHIAPEDLPAMARFVRRITEQLGLQIILVSHSSELAADAHKVFSVSNDGVASTVREEVDRNEI